MPFTPFHLGFAIILFSIIPFLDPITLVLGTVIIDLEAIYCLVTNSCALHGPIHSVLGIIVFFIPLTALSWIIYKKLRIDRFILIPKYNLYLSLFSGVIALFSHIFFDAIIYEEMMILYPFSKVQGLLYGLCSSRTDYIILSSMFFIGFVLLVLRYFLLRTKVKKGTLEEN